MATIEEVEETLFQTVDLLDDLQLPYAVMGGLAIRVYSIPRATQDVDITVAIRPERLESLRDGLFGCGFTIPPVYDSGWLDRVAGMPLFKVERHLDGHAVDVDIFVVESDFQKSIVDRRGPAPVGNRTVQLASQEDLILLKLIADRPRDRIDVQDLLFVLGELDDIYITQWADRLGAAEKWQKAKAESGR